MKKQTSGLLILAFLFFCLSSCVNTKGIYEHHFEQVKITTEDSTGKKITEQTTKKTTKVNGELISKKS